MDEKQIQDPRQYRIKSSSVWQFGSLIVFLAGLLTACVVAFTPLREYIPSNGTEEMQQKIKEHSLRVTALQDSLDAQLSYAMQLRMLMMGQIDSTMFSQTLMRQYKTLGFVRYLLVTVEALNPRRHFQQIMSSRRCRFLRCLSSSIPATRSHGLHRGTILIKYTVPSAPPPVEEGVLTRGFDARNGHYAIDIAVEEGTVSFAQ